MTAALLLIFYADESLDHLDLTDTSLGALLRRDYPPGGLLMMVTFMVLITLGASELSDIFRAKQIEAGTIQIALSGAAGCALIYVMPHQFESLTTLAIFATFLVVVFLGSLIWHSARTGRVEGAVAVGAASLFALIYMGVLPGFFLAIRRWHSAWVVGAIILTTKSCDIGAFFAGRSFGRHKMVPWLSPGKTWEGLAGGVVASALVAVGLAALLNELHLAGPRQGPPDGWAGGSIPYSLPSAAVAGVIFGLVGQLGDLTASLFKRDAGIKDSGRTLPGFGGLLDVFDSPILVAPVAYWLLELAGTEPS